MHLVGQEQGDQAENSGPQTPGQRDFVLEEMPRIECVYIRWSLKGSLTQHPCVLMLKGRDNQLEVAYLLSV